MIGRNPCAQRSEIPVTRCDGSPGVGQRMVHERHLFATVNTSSFATGRAIVWIAKACDGGGHPPPLVTLAAASVRPLDEVPVRGG
jgi:hypothetical protein